MHHKDWKWNYLDRCGGAVQLVAGQSSIESTAAEVSDNE